MMSMGDNLRVGIFSTHPIQYHVPWYRELSREPGIDLTVFYNVLLDADRQGRGFGRSFQWDIPIFEDYGWRVQNIRGEHRDLGEKRLFSSVYGVMAEGWDVALITGWNDPYLVKAACWARGLSLPSVVRGESTALQPRPFYKHWLHRIYLSLFDRYLAIGRSNRSFYLNHGVPEGNIETAGYFVDNQRFDQDYRRLKGRRAELRAEWGIGEEDFCVLFVGKFIEQKQPLDLVNAFLDLREKFERVHLLMVGEGSLLEDCKEKTRSQSSSVTFTGFLNQTDIARAYMAGDALVLPSDYRETWGLVVNEGMIFELPAIVSDRVGCGPDLIREGETGFVFPFGDVEALTQRMATLVGNRPRSRQMGWNARELVLSEYNLDNHVRATKRVLHDAVRNSRRDLPS